MNEEFRAFWSVIPATVLDDMTLPANAKILYGVLSSLMRREGCCWPSNAQLAEAMHCSEDVVTRWVSALSKGGHIKLIVEPNRKTGGTIRRIFPSLPEPVLVDGAGGYSDKCPSGYSDKNPRVVGQTSESLYIDGKKKDNKKKKEKEKPQSANAVAASLLEKCEPYGQDVVELMQQFLQMRVKLGKPIRTPQSATLNWNKLVKLSSGDSRYMAAMLTKAIEGEWLSVYALKADDLRQLQQSAPSAAADHVDLSGLEFV